MENTNSNTLKADFAAGFSVALVALPLSIGIALASGAPASAGLIAAIIGGIIGSWLGGSYITINGPAAGLIVIVLDAVNSLGFRGMLGAAVVAGAIQIIFGAVKLGRKGSAFPASVIHGMMAAIGVIIIAKQTHIMIGHVPVAKNPIMLLAELPMSFSNFNPMVCLVGVLTLALLIVWNQIKHPVLKKIPGPLLGVMFGAAIAYILGMEGKTLLNVPSDIRSWIIFPDFSVMSTGAGWKAAITLCLVGSLETVLSAAAADKLDPLKRKSNLDRDLLSKGVTNVASAMIGGLPMIAEIVRSSANVSYGAKTWKANFTHGCIILLAVIALPSALNVIPLSALAAILVMIGWRLGSPKHFFHALEIGKDNVVGFAVTMVLTLAVDLLVGIFCGALAQFAVEMYLGLKIKNSFKPDFKVADKGDNVYVDVESSLIFSNFLPLKEEITKNILAKKTVKIDLTKAEYIDHSVMEQLEELRSYSETMGAPIYVNIAPEQTALGHSALSARKRVA